MKNNKKNWMLDQLNFAIVWKVKVGTYLTWDRLLHCRTLVHVRKNIDVIFKLCILKLKLLDNLH